MVRQCLYASSAERHRVSYQAGRVRDSVLDVIVIPGGESDARKVAALLTNHKRDPLPAVAESRTDASGKVVWVVRKLKGKDE